MKNMKCRKCGGSNFSIKQNTKNPDATDLYCLDCGAWQKFASKDEIRLLEAEKKSNVKTLEALGYDRHVNKNGRNTTIRYRKNYDSTKDKIIEIDSNKNVEVSFSHNFQCYTDNDNPFLSSDEIVAIAELLEADHA